MHWVVRSLDWNSLSYLLLLRYHSLNFDNINLWITGCGCAVRCGRHGHIVRTHYTQHSMPLIVCLAWLRVPFALVQCIFVNTKRFVRICENKPKRNRLICFIVIAFSLSRLSFLFCSNAQSQRLGVKVPASIVCLPPVICDDFTDSDASKEWRFRFFNWAKDGFCVDFTIRLDPARETTIAGFDCDDPYSRSVAQNDKLIDLGRCRRCRTGNWPIKLRSAA